jgi:hypothetical protein
VAGAVVCVAGAWLMQAGQLGRGAAGKWGSG